VIVAPKLESQAPALRAFGVVQPSCLAEIMGWACGWPAIAFWPFIGEKYILEPKFLLIDLIDKIMNKQNYHSYSQTILIRKKKKQN